MKILLSKGFSLVEMIVVLSIVSLISVGIGAFTYQGMKLWNITQDHVEAQENVRVAFRSVVGEIREMIISDNGSYPIEYVDDFSIVFFANIDDDTKREKVKYELSNGILYRWVTESDGGEPAQYPAFTQDDRSVIAQDIINIDYLFKYFDNSYNGASDPLADPFELNEISLVQMRLVIDSDPNALPAPIEVETNISLRNLKYKYEN
ncbi:prepilin-type N-terminal cleavage/methylation domain-containing protein [Patescibacteria group bacterium]|nr:prepilin-type N-terminal cleavage/methylation domain-containing protein [Patescibacteria group bacterium]MBU0964309.1 prepilin-type N-terminal cleavage/methylation domain-containing protein [Patescibacteria group bacterium]